MTVHRLATLPWRGVLVWGMAAALTAAITLGLLGSRQHLETRLTRLARDLDAVDTLEAEHRALAGVRPAPARTGTTGTPTEPLRVRAEAAARRALIRGRLVSAVAAVDRGAAAEPRDTADRDSVEMRLTDVPLPEIVAVIHEIETGDATLAIRRLDLRRGRARDAGEPTERRIEVEIEVGTPGPGLPR